ncbi:MAG: DUF1826 domain-containing protein [Alphaproteobacteria bacterium]
MSNVETTTCRPHRVSSAVFGPEVNILSEIVRPEVSLAVWLRGRGPTVEELLPDLPVSHADGCDGCNSFEIAAHCAPLSIERGIARILPRRSVQRTALARDVAELAALFARLIKAPRLEIRLERVETDSCRKFHTDWVSVRLLCTYLGGGTQWLPEESADRRMLRRGGNKDICLDPGSVQSLPQFAVGLFKGEAWPGNEGRGVIHRSPPIAASGGARVLLCIDATQ